MDVTLSLKKLNQEIINCNRCKRLVKWRKYIARQKTARYKVWKYWGKPVPGFGDPKARLLIVGLAPAAHGGNRTGRMFTGDRSGDFLYKALYKFGFSNTPISTSSEDGLKLKDCYITASAHCAPPSNKLTQEELLNCQHFLFTEFLLLKRVKVIIALGRTAFETIFKLLTKFGMVTNDKLLFGHGKEYVYDNKLTLIASFHPSQRNTFTGKLTVKMFNAILKRVNHLLHRN